MSETPDSTKIPLGKATVARTLGPFPGASGAYGVCHDGQCLWVAGGDQLRAIDPQNGEPRGTLQVAAHKGTAFDGVYLYQLDHLGIQKIDLGSGEVVATLPAPDGDENSGMAWAEGFLWIGNYQRGLIHRVDAESGEVLATLRSDRLVTGVAWVDGELWHGTHRAASGGEQCELRRISPDQGEVLERVELPAGSQVSGLSASGRGEFYCGAGSQGTVNVVKQPGNRKG